MRRSGVLFHFIPAVENDRQRGKLRGRAVYRVLGERVQVAREHRLKGEVRHVFQVQQLPEQRKQQYFDID